MDELRALDAKGDGYALSDEIDRLDAKAGQVLKDLYVAEAARGGGAARALMTAAMVFAQRHNYTRIDWTTDATNARARRFYAGLGVAPADKVFYRVTGEALARAAAGAWPEGSAA